MHKRHLKKIKIIILASILGMVLFMVAAVELLRDNYYWRADYLAMQWDYFLTKAYLMGYDYRYKSESSQSNNLRETEFIPVFLYHGVIKDSNWQPDGVSIELDNFRQHMFTLKKAGYHTITLEDYYAYKKGEKRLPEKSFILTFDDGRKDSYYPVDPILRALDYKAVMTVITSRSLGPESEKNSFHLSEIELRKMLGSGRWQLESHGKNDHDYQKIDASGRQGHYLSNKIWLDDKNRLETEEEYRKRIQEDLLRSKLDLEKTFGIKVLAFAYPFGDFGQKSENFSESRNIILGATESIYALSFYQSENDGFPANHNPDPFLIKRINVDSSFSADDLIDALERPKREAKEDASLGSFNAK